MITESLTQSFHAHYCSLTGFDRPFTIQMRYKWERWLFEKYTLDDLSLVIKYLKRKIKQNKRELASLAPRNLIEDTERFADDLVLARAESINKEARGDENRRSVLEATSRTVESQKSVRSAGKIMDGPTMATLLKQWRMENA